MVVHKAKKISHKLVETHHFIHEVLQESLPDGELDTQKARQCLKILRRSRQVVFHQHERDVSIAESLNSLH